MQGAGARSALVYDGDCAFCTGCARLLGRIGAAAQIVSWQQTDLEALGISLTRAQEAVQWVDADGAVRSGHEAIAAALASAGRPWSALGRALLLPVVSWLAARTYGWIAANRQHLSRIFRRLSGTA